jgi:hypothetical protein
MATFFNSWIQYSSEVIFIGSAAPNPNKFFIGLSSATSFARSQTLIDIISQELTPQFGYTRANAVFSAGSYSTNNQRYEFPTVSLNLGATGGSLQFQSIFMLADAEATPALTLVPADFNAATDTITKANHGRSNGDQLIFSAASLSTLPGGITTTQTYTVSNATTNTFQLNGINITDIGSGTFYARNANGRLVMFSTESALITIADGQSQPIVIPLIGLNTGYVAGV